MRRTQVLSNIQHQGQINDNGISGMNPMDIKPALIDFKDVQGGSAGEVLFCGLVRRHFFQC